MRDYRQYIQDMKDKWIGKTVSYKGEQYKVVDVDYNGGLHLNKKAQFTDTTAVAEYMLDLEAVEA